MQDAAPNADLPETPRPWYREPWPWVLIALPSAAVVGGMISLWLALSHPDFLVVDEIEYTKIQSAIKATPPAAPPAGAAVQETDENPDTPYTPGTDQR